MKKSLLIFFFVISLFAKAQTSVYHPFPDSNAVWREAHDSFHMSFYSTNEQLFINGDTIIGAYTYHKIYATGVGVNYLTFLCLWLNGPPYMYFAGTIRQDIPNKKVYTYDTNQHQDILLYDFNLNVGDTLPNSYNHTSTDTIVVTFIDSVFDGVNYRKQFYLSSYGADTLKLIEGIGSTWGLFVPLESPFEDAFIMHCFIHNDSIRYSDNCSIGCNLYTSIENISAKNISLNIFPTPATSELKIENGELRIKEIEIYNTVGEKILSQQPIANNQKQIAIDVSHFIPGIYFITVTDEAGNKAVKKIVKM